MVAQAELWLMETPNQKRRPVLIVSRDEVIPVLNNIVVAPVTNTIRAIPTCIPVGVDEGIDHGGWWRRVEGLGWRGDDSRADRAEGTHPSGPSDSSRPGSVASSAWGMASYSSGESLPVHSSMKNFLNSMARQQPDSGKRSWTQCER